MTTAVDSSVLLDVMTADPQFGQRSREALRVAYDSGALVACEVVWSEVRAHFSTEESFRKALAGLGVRFEPTSQEAAELAGQQWRQWRRRQRSPRSRLIADFLVGAHAQVHSDALLTRDRGFYRDCFSRLKIVDPTR